jgi:hypothetical protein
MPSAEHEALVRLAARNPWWLRTVLATQLNITLPSCAVVKPANNNLSDLAPMENNADSVFVHEDPDGMVRYAVIVEIQRQADKDKVYSWLVYLAMARRRHRCPAIVVVIATNRRAAKFASAPIDTGHPGCHFTPVVVGPDQIPAIDEATSATADPCSTTLAVIVHQEEPDQLHAFAAAMNHLDGADARFYAGLALQAMAENQRDLLEGIMETERYDYWAKLEERGRQEGREEGRAEAVLTILANRGLAVSAAVRESIRRCRDANQINTWLKRALTVNKAEDLLA